MAIVLEAMIGVQTSEIDFWVTNILEEQNSEARRREMRCPSLLHISSVLKPDEVLDLNRSPINKIFQSEQTLALHSIQNRRKNTCTFVRTKTRTTGNRYIELNDPKRQRSLENAFCTIVE
ncbi:MAG: hypothetical protein EZS28_026413 [Streblomastix strix]|uniref:Uncharacterized protein n=1 Tax=Streblomastix strix TaxID=222440 RepID=A0A5J4V787_9EUKA|nr:MAG: hypothetical protein EZS28_026413 [Streblomastix strix]